MPGRVLERVYVDSCIFIAWLEANEKYDLAAIQELFEDFKAQNVMLFTSAITRIEVMRDRNNPEKYRDFLALVGNPFFNFVAADNRLVDEAHEIRNWLLVRRSDIKAKGSGKITTSTPDSIHLASAGRTNCDVFLTYDGMDPEERIDRKLLNLKSLDFANYRIPILMPKNRNPATKPAPAFMQDSLFGGHSEVPSGDSE